jgi:lipid-binding SYLF domain-containing protein
MSKIYSKRWLPGLVVFAVALGFVLAPARLLADDEDPLEDERERALEAAEVLREIMKTEDHAIPEYLLERAEGIAVIPGMIKGAFGIGGSGGKGLISARHGNDWSSPLFMTIGGASFGLQIGAESSDIILVFTDEKGIAELVEDKVKLGADVSVAAGPVGRKAEAGTNVTLDSAIYSYSRNKGLFAGIALDGTVVDIDDSENEKVYGKKVDAQKVLRGKADLPASELVNPFMVALKEIMPAKGVTTGSPTE